MTCAIDHVGRVVARRHPRTPRPPPRGPSGRATAFLGAYRAGLGDRRALFDERLLAPFEVAQEAHEFVYAARYLPRWLYVPDARDACGARALERPMTWSPDPDASLRDLEAKPAALRTLADVLTADPWGRLAEHARVVILGMGSSRFAAVPVAARLRARGIDAVAEYASTTAGSPAGPARWRSACRPAVRRRRPCEALARHREAGSTTVAVTNDDAGPLVRGRRVPAAACSPARRQAASPAGPSSTRWPCCSRSTTRAAAADATRRAADATEDLLARRDAWLPARGRAARSDRPAVPARARCAQQLGRAGRADVPRRAPVTGRRVRDGRLAPCRRLPDEAAGLPCAAVRRLAVRRRGPALARRSATAAPWWSAGRWRAQPQTCGIRATTTRRGPADRDPRRRAGGRRALASRQRSRQRSWLT